MTDKHQQRTFGLIQILYRVPMVVVCWMQPQPMDVENKPCPFEPQVKHTLSSFHRELRFEIIWADVSVLRWNCLSFRQLLYTSNLNISLLLTAGSFIRYPFYNSHFGLV
jgi:hypothetical protein